MATIKDVARRAGVSVATVSHVVNQSRAVNAETRERVLEAITALKYRRDGIARSMRVNQTGTIAVLVSDITNPFFAELVHGIENTVYARADQYNLLLCNTEESVDRERRLLDLVLGKRIDGIIMAPAGGNQSAIAEVIQGGVPVVFADRTLPGIGADSVVVDNREASFRIVDHLIDLGHRRIAVLQADLDATSIRERVSGFKDAMAAANLPVSPDLFLTSRSRIEDAVAVGERLLDTADRPTAVFATNNFMTLGMMRALLRRGLTCPDDLAIVGFDDFPWADAFHPRLTVVAQPTRALGEEASRLLFDRITKRRTGPAVRVTLAAEMIVRDSCGTTARRSRGRTAPAPT